MEKSEGIEKKINRERGREYEERENERGRGRKRKKRERKKVSSYFFLYIAPSVLFNYVCASVCNAKAPSL